MARTSPRDEMLRRRANERGLAEIVGTLMLVLIVVSAAVAFSIFVASYQSQLQAQESATHLTQLEALHVLSVYTAPVSVGSPEFKEMTLTIASGDVNEMWIQDFLVNGQPVINFSAIYLGNATSVHDGGITVGALATDTNTTLFMPALQQIAISLDLDNSTAGFSFLSPSDIPTSNSFLVLDFQTSRSNSFKSVYIPPTAIATVSYVESSSGSGPVQYPLLDGTTSSQEGGNATIVGWAWNITQITPPGTSFTAYGAQVELTDLSANDTYSATVTVTNSIGLFAVSLPVDFQG